VLVAFGYSGKLYPVNPQENEILGIKTYSRVTDIPEPVEFATITTPAPAVPAIVEECLAKGVKAVQILSAGFREAGEEGQRLEDLVARTAAKGIRVVGPNCFGIYSPAGGLTILPGEDLPKESGPVAFISQSGGYSIRVPRRASSWGIRFSQVVSYGNACDINECDLLEYFSQDPETKVITGYIEGPRDGPRFFRLLKEVSQTKPVIIWKGGLTKGGARAVNSHTGSLGGEEAVWDALFRQTGAIRVNGIEELIDTILGFLYLAEHRGRRITVVGGGGGIGVAAADAGEKVGLSVPSFRPELQKRLASMVPPAGASTRNPVDVGSPGPLPQVLRSVLETVFTEGEVDIAIIDELNMSIPNRARRNPGAGDPFASIIAELSQIPVEVKKRLGKPIMMVLPVEANGPEDIDFEEARRKTVNYYLSEGIPVFLTLERAVKALANLVNYYERRDAIASIK
jgi:acyl-CoA synthetase (NDP forming)